MIPRVRDIWLALAIVLIAACAQYNPIRAADTNQQRALAAYGSVSIVVEQIAGLVGPETLPTPIQARLIAAGEVGGKFAREGLKVYLEVEDARAAFQADATQEGRLLAALNNLNSWIDRVGPVTDDLKAVLRGAQ